MSVPGSTVPAMSYLTQNQPLGTPTWIDLGIPDLDRAMTFYGALFVWEVRCGTGGVRPLHPVLTLRGKPVAAIQAEPRSGRHGLLEERLLRDG